MKFTSLLLIFSLLTSTLSDVVTLTYADPGTDPANSSEETTPPANPPANAPATPPAASGEELEISPMTIPAQCKDQAMGMLISKPSYDSSNVGARLWSLDRIQKARPANDQDKNCLDVIWKQAIRDENDYWAHIAKKYKCLSEEGTLPSSRPSSCSESKWRAVQSNIGYLRATARLKEIASSSGVIGQTCDIPNEGVLSRQNLEMLGTSLNAVARTGNEKREPVDNTIKSGISPEEVYENVRADSSCRLAARDANGNIDESKLKEEYQSPEYRNAHHEPPGVAANIGSCIMNVLKGALNNFKDMLTGIGSTVMGLWHLYKSATDLQAQIVLSLFHASLGTLIRQKWTEGKEMWQSLVKKIEDIPNILVTKLSNEYQEFRCFNARSVSDKVCSIAGYAGVDLLMLILPGMMVTKLSKIPKIGEAIGKIGAKIIEVQDFIGNATKVAAKFVFKLPFKILAVPLRILDKIPLIHDLSSNLWIKIVGDKIATEVPPGSGVWGTIENSPSITKRMLNAAERRFGPSRTLAEASTPAEADVTKARKTLGQWTWSKLSPEQRQARALAAHAEKSVSDVAVLPKDFPVEVNELSGKKLADLKTPNEITAYMKASRVEAQQTADLLDLKRVTVETGTAESGNPLHTTKYIMEDSKKLERDFYLVQKSDGTKVYQTEQLWQAKAAASAANSDLYPVYLSVDPSKMGKALPELLAMATGKQTGSLAVEMGASREALQGGQRLAIYFADPAQAKKYMAKASEYLIEHQLQNGPLSATMGAMRAANKAWEGTKTLMQTVRAAAITRCGIGQDKGCYCHEYLQAGLNPESGLPIQVSPFSCNTQAEERAAFDVARQNYSLSSPDNAEALKEADPIWHENVDTDGMPPAYLIQDPQKSAPKP